MNYYTVYWTNHGYHSAQEFASLEEAKRHVQNVGFAAHVSGWSEDNKAPSEIHTWDGIMKWRRLA